MPNLTQLFLFELPITDEAFVGLKSMPRLQTLFVKEIPVSDKGLENVKGLKELASLTIDPAGQIGASGLAHLKGLPKLKELNLFAVASNSKIDDVALKEIGEIASLEILVFGPELPAFPSDKSTAFTDAGLAHLARLKNLKKLNISYSGGVTDAGLAHLKVLANLETLTIGFCPKLTDAGLAHLQGLTKLEDLTLNGLLITDAGLANLKALPELRRLDLRDTGAGVTDKGILLFKDCKFLQDSHLVPHRDYRKWRNRVEKSVAQAEYPPVRATAAPGSIRKRGLASSFRGACPCFRTSWVARPESAKGVLLRLPRPSQTQGVPPTIEKGITLIVVKLNHTRNWMIVILILHPTEVQRDVKKAANPPLDKLLVLPGNLLLIPCLGITFRATSDLHESSSDRPPYVVLVDCPRSDPHRCDAMAKCRNQSPSNCNRACAFNNDASPTIGMTICWLGVEFSHDCEHEPR